MSKYDSLIRNDREPVESLPLCIPLFRIRRELRGMIPGVRRRIQKTDVQRTLAYDDYIYWINGVKLTLDQAVDVVAERAPLPKRPPKKAKPDRLPTAPAPREFPTAINHNEPIATIRLALPLEVSA